MSISNIDRALYERDNMAAVINELEEELGDALAERDALRAALHDMISVAQSQGWDNAELHNAIEAAKEDGQ